MARALVASPVFAVTVRRDVFLPFLDHYQIKHVLRTELQIEPSDFWY